MNRRTVNHLRTQYLKLTLTKTEAARLYARASKRRLPITSMIRAALGWEVPPAATYHGGNPSANERCKLKIRVSEDERATATDAAAAEGITISNYLRRELGLKPGQNRVGAPDENRNRVWKPTKSSPNVRTKSRKPI